MPISASIITNAITGMWTTDSRIKSHDPLFLSAERGGLRLDDAFTWTPTSVEPRKVWIGRARYGLAVGEVKQVQPSGNWLVPIFFGVRADSGDAVTPYVSLPLVFDGNGNLAQGTSPTLVQQSNEGQRLELPEELFFAPAPVNAALLVLFFGMQIADIIARIKAQDRTAEQLSLGPLSSLFANQALDAARIAFQNADQPDVIAQKIAAVKAAYERYWAAVKSWPLARNWPDKDDNAKDYGDEGIRVWKPSVVLDQQVWALHTKFDITRSGGADDHVIVVASGVRSSSGALQLVSIGSTARIAGLPDQNVTIKPTKKLEQSDVYGAWADALRGSVIALPADDQKKIEKIIHKLGFKQGEKAGEDLLSWIATAERG